MKKPTPDELIEDLREAGRTRHLEVWKDVPLNETVEWEAADFIHAAAPLLAEAAGRDDDLGRRAAKLIGGDYPTTPEDQG